MAELDESFIDIGDKKKTYLTKDQIQVVKENPEGLTKEGCQEHVKNWEKSKNRYTIAMYRVMLKKCEKFTPSGKTTDGRPILSKSKEGKITWVGQKEEI